jgi:hypothetical protein
MKESLNRGGVYRDSGRYWIVLCLNDCSNRANVRRSLFQILDILNGILITVECTVYQEPQIAF